MYIWRSPGLIWVDWNTMKQHARPKKTRCFSIRPEIVWVGRWWFPPLGDTPSDHCPRWCVISIISRMSWGAMSIPWNWIGLPLLPLVPPNSQDMFIGLKVFESTQMIWLFATAPERTPNRLSPQWSWIQTCYPNKCCCVLLAHVVHTISQALLLKW